MLSLRRKLTRIAAAAAAVALLAGCSNGGGDGSDADEDGPIVIGGSLGLTGIYSGPSAQYLAAYEYWADEVNANGGLLGREVELIIYDDESTPNVAQQLYQQLVNEDGADLLIAPYTTAVGAAVIPIAERADTLMFNGGFVGKQHHANTDYMISGWGFQDVEYARGLFEYWDTLPEDERPETIALLTAQNPFTLAAREGFDGSDGVLGYAEERGMEIVLDQEYEQTATDLTSLVQRAASADADALIALSLPEDAALIARTVGNVGYDPDFYCQCGSQVTSLPNWPDLGGPGVNVFASTQAWPNQDYFGLEGFSDYMFDSLGVDVLPAHGVAGYVSVQVLEQAVEGSGSLDTAELREYVMNNTFETAAGEYSYNEDGTPDFTQLLLQYQEDGNIVAWPEEWSTGEVATPLLSR